MPADIQLGHEGEITLKESIDSPLTRTISPHIDQTDLQVPHAGLLKRPFALLPLADIAPFWRHPIGGKLASQLVSQWQADDAKGVSIPFNTYQIPQRIDSSGLVGVLNLSVDSFSDGGNYATQEAAIQHAKAMVKSGAEIIDIGAQATSQHIWHVDKTGVSSADMEINQLIPVIRALANEFKTWPLPPKISVDTYNSITMQAVLQEEVDWLNDVSGLESPEVIPLLQSSNASIVVMHNLGVPPQPSQVMPLDQDIKLVIYRWFEEKLDQLQRHNIALDRVILDVGIGFGKTSAQSLYLIQHISFFRRLGAKLLLGHSRKSCLNQFTLRPPKDRDIETIAISALANRQVDYLRVHNVADHARFFKVLFMAGIHQDFPVHQAVV